MTQLSDNLVAELRAQMQLPDLTGTRYRILRYVAAGGMGSVWLVEDTILNRRAVLKVLDLVAPADDLGVRLLQEARVLAGLEHPGIVPVHDAGILADGRAFYCMKYVEGETLAGYIVGMSLADKLRLFERIAEPVDFAHSRGFIHRDLKPENIMVGAFSEVLVMDWGLAKVTSARQTRENDDSVNFSAPKQQTMGSITDGKVLGTPGFMSPEQESGTTPLDRRTDIFSLGAILWFMVTGSIRGEHPAIASGVPRALRAICRKAMASDPNARYQSASEITADLNRYLSGESVSAYQEGWFERGQRMSRRHRTAIVLIAVYLLMRVLFILLHRT